MKKRFTLIELLAVVSIIALLVGILLPAVQRVRVRGQITKAKYSMTALYSAIKLYEQEYGYLPCSNTTYDKMSLGSTSATSSPSATSPISRYRMLIELLSCTSGPGPTIAVSAASSWPAKSKGTAVSNYKAIRFLDVPSTYGTLYNPQGGTTTACLEGDYTDPWGNFFQVFLDTNYDGKVDDSDVDGTAFKRGFPNGLSGSVFIYSFGPNRHDDYGLNTQFGEGAGNDDVCQWR